MTTLAVILARAGSKGLPDKCVLPLCGRPVVAHTIAHAQQSTAVDAIVLTTDSPRIAAIGEAAGVMVIRRPPELATDLARVDDAVRHAVGCYEEEFTEEADPIVILYGNVPIRADGVIDRCIDRLIRTRADSVRTVAPVTKQHPDWIHQLDDDRMIPFRHTGIHRRQDLEPLYYHDGSAVAVRRGPLMAAATSPDPHAFFGDDRRAVLQHPDDTVDIDSVADFYHAEAMLRVRNESAFWDPPTAGSRRPPFTAAVAYAGAHDRR